MVYRKLLESIQNDPVLAATSLNQLPEYKVKIIERAATVTVIVDSFSEEQKSVILKESIVLSRGETKANAIEACCRKLFFTIFLRGAATLHYPWSEPFLPDNLKNKK